MKKAALMMFLCGMLLAAAHAWASTEFTFYPLEDTWVNQDNPIANYSSNSYLTVKDRSCLTEAYFKFSDADMAKLSGLSLLGASLYLYQYQGTYSPGDSIGAHKVTSGWDQNAVTWNSKPAYEAQAISSLDLSDNVTEGWREWGGLQQCVSSWAGGANYGLALENSNDLVNNELFARFYSSESADFKPYLKVTAAPEPVSTVLFLLGGGALSLATRKKNT